MIQAKSNAKNTRQILQNKPKKYFTFLTRNRLHVQSFRIMGAEIASWDKYLIHDKWKILKITPLPIVLFTDVSLNLIKKGLWFTLRYFIKFNNKQIFEYQNIHLLHGSIWKKLDTKGVDKAKLLEDSDPLITAAELKKRLPKKVQNVFIMATVSPDQRKNAGKTESSKMSSYVLRSFTLRFYF